MNGGSCIDSREGYSCICKDEFSGDLCEIGEYVEGTQVMLSAPKLGRKSKIMLRKFTAF